jgi:hypothetical protein
MESSPVCAITAVSVARERGSHAPKAPTGDDVMFDAVNKPQ